LLRNRNVWFASTVFIACLLVAHYGILQVNNRFDQVEKVISNSNIHAGTGNDASVSPEFKQEDNSTSAHINLWQNAVELIDDHPLFGVGTGDLKEELSKYYAKNHFNYGLEKNYSPHNQVLHTAVILGIFGCLFLLAMFLVPLFLAFSNKDWVYFFFLLIVLMNCMTESILEVQKGVLFFAFFNTWFYQRIKTRENTLMQSL